jgi:hypothetical protein
VLIGLYRYARKVNDLLPSIPQMGYSVGID